MAPISSWRQTWNRLDQCTQRSIGMGMPISGYAARRPAEVLPTGVGLRGALLEMGGTGSFDINDVVEPVNPVREPIRQAMLRYPIVEFGRGAQATCGLKPSQCPA
jgi:hypothetical protein